MQEIREATHAMAKALRVIGLMNVQYAIKREGDQQVLYVLEVNPRASRTVPFVSKATGVPVAKVAAKAMAGVSLSEQGLTREPIPSHVSVKESVFPFNKFVGVDIVLGPEMKSTGEVMGVSERFSIAFAKAQLAGGTVLPSQGQLFISLATNGQKEHMLPLARRLVEMGYQLVASAGTCTRFEQAGIPCLRIKKLQEGHPNVLDLIIDGRIQLVMNTPRGKGARTDEGRIRASAVAHGVPCITTMQAVEAAVKAMEALKTEEMTVQALQDRFPSAEAGGQKREASVVGR
jgi:carbamoyl-phosphate synthase large subunit